METLGEKDYFYEKVCRSDLVLVDVVSSPKKQLLSAKVSRVYSTGFGVVPGMLGAEVEFMTSPGWGNPELNVGDRAIVFLRKHSGGFWQDNWWGHFLLEEIDGGRYGVFEVENLWLQENIPSEVRACTVQDPKRAWASAIRFDVLEEYLEALVNKRVALAPLMKP
jgi:hypothetical protein